MWGTLAMVLGPAFVIAGAGIGALTASQMSEKSLDTCVEALADKDALVEHHERIFTLYPESLRAAYAGDSAALEALDSERLALADQSLPLAEKADRSAEKCRTAAATQ